MGYNQQSMDKYLFNNINSKSSQYLKAKSYHILQNKQLFGGDLFYLDNYIVSSNIITVFIKKDKY